MVTVISLLMRIRIQYGAVFEKNIETTVTISQVWNFARMHNVSIYFDVD